MPRIHNSGVGHSMECRSVLKAIERGHPRSFRALIPPVVDEALSCNAYTCQVVNWQRFVRCCFPSGFLSLLN